MFLRSLLVAMLMATVVAAQADAPTLTDVQTLRVQNALLRVQLAVSELERARDVANTLIHSLQRPGYTLDLEQMKYVPVKETPTQ